jgi:two-component system LytT family response regulator
MRALIVDDEPLARGAIRTRLLAESDIVVVGEAVDGPDAVAAIEQHAPDLVFLDVQMPGMSGFEVLDRLPAARLPQIVFVTAYDAYAVQAFEVHALDYLLKPYSEDRFRACLERARHTFRAGTRGEQRLRVRSLLERFGSSRATASDPRLYPDRFAVRERGEIAFVAAADLEAVQSAGNYIVLAAPPTRHLLRGTLADFEARLDPERFARIHRKTIVRIDRVRSLLPDSHGDCQVRMASGAEYRLSRGYRGRLLA